MSMNISGINTYVYESMAKKKKELKGTKVADAQKEEKQSELAGKNESKLSAKAQQFLSTLREKYGDYDFMIGNNTEDDKELCKSGTKEFSVIFSSEEIERMANDEKYAQEKMQGVEGAVEMSKRICEEYGFTSAFSGKTGENGILNRLNIVVDDKGSMKIFAELEKTSKKQTEKNPYLKDENATVKKTTVEAASVEDLIEKMKNIDWDKISQTETKSGDRINFSV